MTLKGDLGLFTGIIEEIGTVKSIVSGANSFELTVGAKVVLEGTVTGDSIAVNGVCLTVTKMTSDSFTADVMPETLRRSALGSLKSGSTVNLERAMAADGRFGGHIVSGHIDGTGKIIEMKREKNAVWVKIDADRSILRLIVEKGSIAIDGISLTVAEVGNVCDFLIFRFRILIRKVRNSVDGFLLNSPFLFLMFYRDDAHAHTASLKFLFYFTSQPSLAVTHMRNFFNIEGGLNNVHVMFCMFLSCIFLIRLLPHKENVTLLHIPNSTFCKVS